MMVSSYFKLKTSILFLQDVSTCLLSGVMAFFEIPSHNKNSQISFVYFDPKNGRVIYDEFIDSKLRDQISSRITCLGPSEILFDELLISNDTRDILRTFESVSLEPSQRLFKSDPQNNFFDGLMFSKGLKKVLEVESFNISKCMGAVYNYLKEFEIEECLLMTTNIVNFKELPRHMKLSGYTIHNLGVFSRSKCRRNSIFDFLNNTCTKFGSRVIRNWLAYPLRDKAKILSRQEAIEELILNKDLSNAVYNLLNKMPDLELALMSTLNKRISPKDFFLFVNALKKSFQVCKRLSLKCQLLLKIINKVIASFTGIHQYSENLNRSSWNGNKVIWNEVFKDFSDYPEVLQSRESLEEVEWNLEMYKLKLMHLLGLYTFEYVSVCGMDYLIEVKNETKVPTSWIKMNATKSVTRYRDPYIKEQVVSLSQKRKKLISECQKAWNFFLTKFNFNFCEYQKGICNLAELDALFGLHLVSKRDGYTKPRFTEGCFEVVGGRHPILELNLPTNSTYIPNDLYLKENKTLILTGPNSGGKSSFLRQTAVICIFAQIGCFVPAKEAKIPILDAIFLRTGAKDNIWSQKSTFYVEMEETSDIISRASSNSLVLLDELGRGTSSYDGLALAESILKFLIYSSNCFTLFVTHYGILTSKFEKLHFKQIRNGHVGYSVLGEENSLILLYKIFPGAVRKSYGINVARLASLPIDVVDKANKISMKYQRSLDLKLKLIDFFSNSLHL
uniref:MutS homolog 3 (E. coli) [Xenopus (Silurana) tropicalis] n=1 Tax=Lepeophtheirus salmonis TaxID=72036 RepID=A0A0K2TI12_LEPSM